MAQQTTHTSHQLCQRLSYVPAALMVVAFFGCLTSLLTLPLSLSSSFPSSHKDEDKDIHKGSQ